MSKNDSPILPQLDQFLADARSAGARASEFLYCAWSGSRVSSHAGHVTHHPPPVGARVQGRVYLPDGRCGLLSLDLDAPQRARERVAEALVAALERARDAEPDPLSAPAERYNIHTRGLGIEDARYTYVDRQSREEVALINEEACNSVAGVVATEVTYSDRLTQRAYASSRGVQAISRDTTYEVRLRARSRKGDLELERVATARNFANVGSLPFGVDLAKRITDLESTGARPAGDLPLVLESRVFAWILEGIAPAFSSWAADRGESFLVGQKDRRIGSHRVHLIDDPGLHGGLLTRAFDDRGVPPMAMPLIKEGMLGGLYQSPESARRADIRPTGHVWEGDLRPSNLILRPGNRSRTQMLSEVPVSLSFDHLEGTVDPTTGKIVAQGPAFVLEKGRRAGAVRSVRFETDVYALLNAVQEVASDQERTRATDCATALVVGIESA